MYLYDTRYLLRQRAGKKKLQGYLAFCFLAGLLHRFHSRTAVCLLPLLRRKETKLDISLPEATELLLLLLYTAVVVRRNCLLFRTPHSRQQSLRTSSLRTDGTGTEPKNGPWLLRERPRLHLNPYRTRVPLWGQIT